MSLQLPLAWPAPAHFRFGHFDPHGNDAALGQAQALARGATCTGPILLAGGAGVGKTHLLVATDADARELGRASAYLALSRWSQFDAQALATLACSSLLMIDEVEAVAGRREAEIALFDLFNRCHDSGCRLLLASRQIPYRLPLVLADLRSRLNVATLITVEPLPEARRRDLLRARAKARGFELDDAVLDFLFRRHRRDLGALMTVVERLDRESLSRQRRVTVPLVRSVLAEPAPEQTPPA